MKFTKFVCLLLKLSYLFLSSSRITVDPEGDLHFSNVTAEDDLDEAMYACSATLQSRNEYKVGNKIILKVDEAGGKNIFHVSLYVSTPSNLKRLCGYKMR